MIALYIAAYLAIGLLGAYFCVRYVSSFDADDVAVFVVWPLALLFFIVVAPFAYVGVLAEDRAAEAVRREREAAR